MDKRSVGSAGKRMRFRVIDCKCGADPPKNPSGRDSAGSEIDEEMVRFLSAGNGFCIAVAIFSDHKARPNPR